MDPLDQLRRDARSFDGPADVDAVLELVDRRRRRSGALRLAGVAVLFTLMGGLVVGLVGRDDPVVVEAATPDVDAFFRDVRAADADGIDRYITLGGDLDVTDDNGLTGVLLASVRNDPTTLATLLESGADPELRNDQGENALHVAARFGFVEVTEVLLANGADPDVAAGSRDARTALHFAVERGEVEVTRTLLAGGADPDARTEGGAPVLESAFGGAPLEIVPLLLAAGADAGADTPWGPLTEVARARGLDEIAELLSEATDGS